MKLNDEYYHSDITDSVSIRFTKTGTLPVNSVFDVSGAYCMSGGEFSPLANVGVVYGGEITSQGGETHYQFEMNYDVSTGQDIPLFLTSRNSGTAFGWSGSMESIPAYAGQYEYYTPSNASAAASDRFNYWWAPTSQGYLGQLENNYNYTIVTGFSYKNVVIYPTISGWNSGFTSQQSGDLATYDFTNYPNISAISYTMYLTGVSGGTRQSFARLTDLSQQQNIFPACTPITHHFIGKCALVDPNDNTTIYEQNLEISQSKYNLFGATTIFDAPTVNSTYTQGHAPTIFEPTDTRSQQGKMVMLYNRLSHYRVSANQERYYMTATKDTVCKIIATLGFYFAATRQAAQSAATGASAVSADLYLPLPDGDGVYRGNYVQGEDIADHPEGERGNNPDDPFDWWEDNGVTGGGGGGEETEDTPLSRPSITAFGAFNRAFAMSQVNLNDLQNYIWNTDDGIFNGLVDGLKMYGENPMNCLIDCRMYPFDILSYISSTGTQNITLGRNQTSVRGIYLGNTTNCVVDLGSVEWGRLTNTFLDFSPYSYGELYVPYIGKFSLDASVYAGHTVSAYIVVDFMTGAAECAVFRDGVATEYKSGQIGVSIPFAGVNASQYAGAVLGGIAATANSVAGFAAGMATGNPALMGASALSGVVNGLETYNTPHNITQQGAASSAASQWLPQQAYLTVYQANHIEPPTYGHTTGYACQISARLGDLSGLVVCSNVDVSGVAATDEEINELKNLLNSGVYM